MPSADSPIGGETGTNSQRGGPAQSLVRKGRSSALPGAGVLTRTLSGTLRPAMCRIHLLVRDLPLSAPPPSSALHHLQAPPACEFGATGAGGACSDLGANHRMSNCSFGRRRMLVQRACGALCAFVRTPSFTPSPGPPPPTHPPQLPTRGSFRNRPAAENSLAGGGCKRSAVERFN